MHGFTRQGLAALVGLPSVEAASTRRAPAVMPACASLEASCSMVWILLMRVPRLGSSSLLDLHAVAVSPARLREGKGQGNECKRHEGESRDEAWEHTAACASEAQEGAARKPQVPKELRSRQSTVLQQGCCCFCCFDS